MTTPRPSCLGRRGVWRQAWWDTGFCARVPRPLVSPPKLVCEPIANYFTNQIPLDTLLLIVYITAAESRLVDVSTLEITPMHPQLDI